MKSITIKLKAFRDLQLMYQAVKETQQEGYRVIIADKIMKEAISKEQFADFIRTLIRERRSELTYEQFTDYDIQAKELTL